MLLSIITPTHNPEHLLDAFRSLTVQKYADWEWVLAPNGAAIGKIPAEIKNHPKVRIFPYHPPEDEQVKIGALKNWCCQNAQGEVFIELDHDDMLVPGVLSKIVEKANEGAGFIFSDAAVFLAEHDNVPTAYSETHGWETYEFKVYGEKCVASKAFNVSPRSLCEVYYAPDHVRCWTREAYYAVGGHDVNLLVGDDHDLICRTYLAGVHFAHTGSCGYLYRYYPGNTIRSHQEEIKQQQNRNRDKYMYKLIDEWLKRTKLAYMDLRWEEESTDIRKNGLTLPRESDSVGCVRAYNFLQTVEQKDVVKAMDEIYRVLVPGGWLCLSAPSTRGEFAFAPVCKSYWNRHNVSYFTKKKYARQVGTKARFQQVRCFEAYPDTEAEKVNGLYIYADLCALKGQRQAGKVEI